MSSRPPFQPGIWSLDQLQPTYQHPTIARGQSLCVQRRTAPPVDSTPQYHLSNAVGDRSNRENSQNNLASMRHDASLGSGYELMGAPQSDFSIPALPFRLHQYQGEQPIATPRGYNPHSSNVDGFESFVLDPTIAQNPLSQVYPSDSAGSGSNLSGHEDATKHEAKEEGQPAHAMKKQEGKKPTSKKPAGKQSTKSKKSIMQRVAKPSVEKKPSPAVKEVEEKKKDPTRTKVYREILKLIFPAETEPPTLPTFPAHALIDKLLAYTDKDSIPPVLHKHLRKLDETKYNALRTTRAVAANSNEVGGYSIATYPSLSTVSKSQQTSLNMGKVGGKRKATHLDAPSYPSYGSSIHPSAEEPTSSPNSASNYRSSEPVLSNNEYPREDGYGNEVRYENSKPGQHSSTQRSSEYQSQVRYNQYVQGPAYPPYSSNHPRLSECDSSALLPDQNSPSTRTYPASYEPLYSPASNPEYERVSSFGSISSIQSVHHPQPNYQGQSPETTVDDGFDVPRSLSVLRKEADLLISTSHSPSYALDSPEHIPICPEDAMMSIVEDSDEEDYEDHYDAEKYIPADYEDETDNEATFEISLEDKHDFFASSMVASMVGTVRVQSRAHMSTVRCLKGTMEKRELRRDLRS